MEKATLSQHEEYQSDDFLWVRIKAGCRVCVQKGELRREVWKQFYDRLVAGHPRIGRARPAVRSLCLWWPRMGTDIEMSPRPCVQGVRGGTVSSEEWGIVTTISYSQYIR